MMAGAPGYTVDEARADAREWIKGTTLHGGSRGWRVCCAILDERIAELEAALAGHRDRLMAANESGMMWRVLADSGQSLQIRSWSQTQRGEHLAAPPPLLSQSKLLAGLLALLDGLDSRRRRTTDAESAIEFVERPHDS